MSIDLHNSSSSPTHIPKAHALLDKFSTVFEEPKGLPPRRDYDHIICLIPGARLVAIRPYRVAPHLKTEMEQQFKELLQNGMISHNPFSSHVLMLRRRMSLGEWSLITDT